MFSKEAIELIKTHNVESEVLTEGERKWLVRRNDMSYQEIIPPSPEMLKTSTLTGLCDYLNGGEDLIVWIRDVTNVFVLEPMDPVFKQRGVHIQATAITSNVTTKQYLSMDDLVVMLMARFHPRAGDLDDLLKFCSSVQAENVRTSEDDGISQKVTVKKTLTTVADVIVPNPVNLQPYLTFPEIDFFSVDFVFRLKKQGDEICGALFETGNVAWMRGCIESIRDFILKKCETARIIY